MSDDTFLAELGRNFAATVPHCTATGIEITTLSPDHAIGRLPYRDDWLADTERGVLHPGIISTLVDSASGAALLARIGRFDSIATLDLRMDYLRAAYRGHDVTCRAECYRLTEHIGFVRARVWQAREDEPVALSQSVFMRGGQGRMRPGPF
jgi:uncharacterized protein (TIGR00369 family)